MLDPETYEVMVLLTTPDGRLRARQATIAIGANAPRASKQSAIQHEAVMLVRELLVDFPAAPSDVLTADQLEAALGIVPGIDAAPYDGDAAGGSQSSRTPLPSGASSPEAQR